MLLYIKSIYINGANIDLFEFSLITNIGNVGISGAFVFQIKQNVLLVM